MGFHDVPEQVNIKTDVDIEATKMYAVRHNTNQILTLSPFYIFSECPESSCRQKHFFRFEKIEKHSIEYVGLGGHRIRVPHDGSALLSLIDESGNRKILPFAKYLTVDYFSTSDRLETGQILSGKYEILDI